MKTQVRLAMHERIQAAMISRRRTFWLLGLGAAFGMGMPAAILTAPGAQAQTPGMERRQDRRDNRRDRRGDRRTNRQDRRDDRRTNRQDRGVTTVAVPSGRGTISIPYIPAGIYAVAPVMGGESFLAKERFWPRFGSAARRLRGSSPSRKPVVARDLLASANAIYEYTRGGGDHPSMPHY